MPVTQEEGGRLNAFAREPKIELLNKKSSMNSSFQLILVIGGVLLVSLIAYTATIS